MLHRSLALLCTTTLLACAPPPAAPQPASNEGEGDAADGEGEVAGEGEAVVGEGEGDGAALVAGEGEGEAVVVGEGEGDAADAPVDLGIPYVFVIAMENKAESGIYGNANAPYINDVLMTEGAYASAYSDCITNVIPSEPHYVWLEAGTNSFDDHTFLFDSQPSASNSTSDPDHLAAQLARQDAGRTWRSYQEGLNADTGLCPTKNAGFYAAKHDPFIFFTDVSGLPPSEINATCAAHHRPFDAVDFGVDLAENDVEAYTFITPDLCHDMHGNSGCTNGCTSSTSVACISEGDRWLSETVPPILDFINAHGGVLMIVWDESEGGSTQPFFIIGPHVKPGYASDVALDHSSYVKSLEMIFELPILDRVTDANDFSDFFDRGFFP